ncbi:hypothetical protein F4781DRAFT_431633 [Annulohypoxylon bovei var. microspora]|nr:hypothetical protein F4781DRAFT_431633 [Annulohypoxylon bovei var. microspora]
MAGRGAPGANSRGRGGKFKKFTRGGGKHFSRDLRPLDADGNEISMWSEGKKDESDSDEEEDSEEEDSDEEDSDAGPSQQSELTREERKQAKKAQKEAAIAKKNKPQVGDMPSDSESEDDEDEGMPVNPNHSKAARNQTKVQPKPDGVEEATEGVQKLAMSRKERESMEAQIAKEKYRKLHEAGKTDEAKADLARLRLIREKRDAEAARKQAEKEEREAHEKARKTEIDAKEAKKREAALGKPGKKGRAK